MNDFFQRMLFNHYLVEQQVCGMFYRIGQRIFASEILGLNQHLFTRRSWKLNNTYTSPIIYTQKAHLLALKPVPLTASSISLYKKTISGWEWRMELWPFPAYFLGEPTDEGQNSPQQFSEAHGWTFDPLGRAANSSLWRLHKLWWKNQLQTPFVRNRSLSVLMGARNTMKWKQCIAASSMCIEIYCAHIYSIYIYNIYISLKFTYIHTWCWFDYFAILCSIEKV